MAEKTSDCKISLIEVPRKIVSSVFYNLKVPNFFILPEYDGTYFELVSPTFEFASATWCFRFESRRKLKSDTGNSIKKFAASMERVNSEIQEHIMFYGIFLLDADDKTYGGNCDAYLFKENNEEHIMVTFDNEKPSYDKRDTLTVIIYLVYMEFPGGVPDQEPLTTTMDRGLMSLSHDFKDVLLNGQDHNLIFRVGDKNFPAHQDILRARSEVFRSMLCHDMIEKNSGVVNVPDCDTEAFEQLLCYVYTGKVDILDANNMFGLYYAADKYNLGHLKEECREFIKKSLSLTNICEALQLATKHSDTCLLDSTMSYFFSNVDDILPTVEWQIFMKENPTVANEIFIKSLKKVRNTKS